MVTSSSFRMGMLRTCKMCKRRSTLDPATGVSGFDIGWAHRTLCFSLNSLLKGALMIVRRAPEAAPKCTLRDLRLEEARPATVNIMCVEYMDLIVMLPYWHLLSSCLRVGLSIECRRRQKCSRCRKSAAKLGKSKVRWCQDQEEEVLARSPTCRVLACNNNNVPALRRGTRSPYVKRLHLRINCQTGQRYTPTCMGVSVSGNDTKSETGQTPAS